MMLTLEVLDRKAEDHIGGKIYDDGHCTCNSDVSFAFSPVVFMHRGRSQCKVVGVLGGGFSRNNTRICQSSQTSPSGRLNQIEIQIRYASAVDGDPAQSA